MGAIKDRDKQAAPPVPECDMEALPAYTPSQAAARDLTEVVRWGWYSIAVNIVLVGLHGLIAAASGSLAVAAELLHNFIDLASAAVVLIGLKLAMRKTRTFPYGLYKLENLIAAGLAMMIFFTAYEVVSSVFLEANTLPTVNAWMLVLLLATMAIPLIFSHFEMRVARRANSPALMADAREYRVHAYTTGLALAALASAWFELPLDRIAALIIVLAVAKTGWDLLADALRVLLDASLDAESLGDIRKTIEADPAIRNVNWMTGRNAGRFRFVEAGVILRLADLSKAQCAVARIEQALRAAQPQVERVLLHVEPRTSHHELCAIPLSSPAGDVSAHFGGATHFAFITIDRTSGRVEEEHIRANPHHDLEHGKGLRVAEWLVRQNMDRVIVSRSLEGKGPAYALAEAGVSVEVSEAQNYQALFSGPEPA